MRRALMGLGVALALSSPALAQETKEVGHVNTALTNLGLTRSHRVVVERFDDPKVQGVSCYISQARTGGLSGMVGRFSAITGPLLWAIVTRLTINVIGLPPQVGQGIGVLVLLVLIIVSYVILQPVSDVRRARSQTQAVN